MLAAARGMESAAQQAGVVVGMIVGIVFMLGIPTLFIVSLIQAIRRKTVAWTVIAAISGLLSLLVVGLFLFGVYTGITRNRDFIAEDQEIPADREVMTDDGLCALTIPEHWQRLDNLHDSATLQVGNLVREEYLVVLTDAKEDFEGTLAQHVEITSDNVLLALESAEKSGPEELEINGYPALRYEITGTTDLVNLVYVQTTIEGKRGFYQLMGWTLKSKADRARDVLIETAATFREIEE